MTYYGCAQGTGYVLSHSADLNFLSHLARHFSSLDWHSFDLEPRHPLMHAKYVLLQMFLHIAKFKLASDGVASIDVKSRIRI